MSIWIPILAILIGIAVLGYMMAGNGSSEEFARKPAVDPGENAIGDEDPGEDVGEILDKRETAAKETPEGTLPGDMPHLGWLKNAGVTTWEQLNSFEKLEDIDYIGYNRAKSISKWLADKYPGSKHAREKNVLSYK